MTMKYTYTYDDVEIDRGHENGEEYETTTFPDGVGDIEFFFDKGEWCVQADILSSDHSSRMMFFLYTDNKREAKSAYNSAVDQVMSGDYSLSSLKRAGLNEYRR